MRRSNRKVWEEFMAPTLLKILDKQTVSTRRRDLRADFAKKKKENCKHALVL
jgi:hypothetical protein